MRSGLHVSKRSHDNFHAAIFTRKLFTYSALRISKRSHDNFHAVIFFVKIFTCQCQSGYCLLKNFPPRQFIENRPKNFHPPANEKPAEAGLPKPENFSACCRALIIFAFQIHNPENYQQHKRNKYSRHSAVEAVKLRNKPRD